MNEKLKYILKLTGITGVVYVSFRYLLPLVIPFVFALLFVIHYKNSGLMRTTLTAESAMNHDEQPWIP